MAKPEIAKIEIRYQAHERIAWAFVDGKLLGSIVTDQDGGVLIRPIGGVVGEAEDTDG